MPLRLVRRPRDQYRGEPRYGMKINAKGKKMLFNVFTSGTLLFLILRTNFPITVVFNFTLTLEIDQQSEN